MQNTLERNTKIFAIGASTGVAGYVCHKWLYNHETGNYFSSMKEIKAFFIASGLYAIGLGLLWDKFVFPSEHETEGIGQAKEKTMLFSVGAMYIGLAISPRKTKWLILPAMIGKVIAFATWCAKFQKFERIYHITTFTDPIWMTGFILAFLQLRKDEQAFADEQQEI